MSHHAVAQGDGDPGPTLFDRVATILEETLHLDRAEILPGCQLRDDFGTLDHEMDDVQEAIEEAFDMTIPAHVVINWRSVADIVTYLERRLSPVPQGAI